MKRYRWLGGFGFGVLVAIAACGDNGGTDDGGTDATADVKLDAPGKDSTANDAGATDGPADVVVDAPPPCTVDAGATYLADAVEISGGADFVCALRADATVACWGSTPGSGSTPKTVVFAADAGTIKLTRIAAQAGTACAIDTTGLVWCWGLGGGGNLGNGTTVPSATTPVLVTDSSQSPIHAVDLGNGYNHMCALTSSGSVLCWGENGVGQLAQDAGVNDAGIALSAVALQVPGLTLTGGSLAKGGAGDYTAGFSSSTVACWGGSGSGECGVTQTPAFNLAMGASFADAGAALPLHSMSHGIAHVCAIDNANHVYCVGDDYYGQCGSTAVSGPNVHGVPELLDAAATEVSCGYKLTCVVDGAQHVQCFGANGNYGYLGIGDAGNIMTPIPQTVIDIDGGAALFPVAHVAAGGDQTCAILTGACGASGPGQVVCWGYGSSGNLGNGQSANSGTPVLVLAPK